MSAAYVKLIFAAVILRLVRLKLVKRPFKIFTVLMTQQFISEIHVNRYL